MDEIYLRRSVRNYLTTPVEKEKLLAVVKAGTCAPSALNNMSRQFTVISNKDIIKELNSAVAAAIDSETLQRINERTNGNFNFFYSAPVLIVVSTERQAFCPASDCAVALENMFLKAEELGLATCWINQLNALSGDKNVRSVLRKAGVPDSHDVYGSCAIGYSPVPVKRVEEKPNKIVFCD